MAKTLFHFASDLVLWALCIMSISALAYFGAIDDPVNALAGGALWFAIRAYRKAEDNAPRQTQEA